MSSGTATNDHVPRADGSGGIDWEAASTRALATSEPADVAAEAETGSGTHAAHGNHVHALGIGDTLEFSASDELSVSITEVIEHLSQQIRYFTSGRQRITPPAAVQPGRSTRRTGIPKNLFKVQAQIHPSTGSIYRARRLRGGQRQRDYRRAGRVGRQRRVDSRIKRTWSSSTCRWSAEPTWESRLTATNALPC